MHPVFTLRRNCFHIFVIQAHVVISQANDSSIMFGHTQSHQNQCPLRQGRSDGAWWTRWEITSDTKIYFLSVQKFYVSKDTCGVCYDPTLYAPYGQQCLPNAATLSLKHQIFPGNNPFVIPSLRNEEGGKCCSTVFHWKETTGSLWGLQKVNWKHPPKRWNAAAFWTGEAGCLNSLCISNRQAQCCLFLTFH